MRYGWKTFLQNKIWLSCVEVLRCDGVITSTTRNGGKIKKIGRYVVILSLSFTTRIWQLWQWSKGNMATTYFHEDIATILLWRRYRAGYMPLFNYTIPSSQKWKRFFSRCHFLSHVVSCVLHCTHTHTHTARSRNHRSLFSQESWRISSTHTILKNTCTLTSSSDRAGAKILA